MRAESYFNLFQRKMLPCHVNGQTLDHGVNAQWLVDQEFNRESDTWFQAEQVAFLVLARIAILKQENAIFQTAKVSFEMKGVDKGLVRPRGQYYKNLWL